MKLTKKQLYDYHDIDRGELKLVRIGHALWAMLRKARKSYLPKEERILMEAIETIMRLKKEKRAELKVQNAARSAKLAERFRTA